MENNLPMSQKTVAQLVAERFERSQVFLRHGIDFCCHGQVPLSEACQAKGLDVAKIEVELQAQEGGQTADFGNWPLDLVVDYVLKWHHRNYYRDRQPLLDLVAKVVRAHGEAHPELHELQTILQEGFEELDAHFAKEEQVLFPHLYDLYAAHAEGQPAPPFHCGSILPPVRQMMTEHEVAGEMLAKLEQLTQGYTTPADGCMSYRALNVALRRFHNDLMEHIHLENNIIFPGFLRMEQEA